VNKDWDEFNVKYLAVPMTALVIGLVIGFGVSLSTNESKHYPIEVKCYWETETGQDYPIMDCDSIKGDTLWRDGRSIVCKNIINVSFK
tara:strand:- start:1913 stop:2176 length:264 start_codon:yes stop_codon:yes gene_type:complete